jgi:hypothetical protein
VTWQPDLWTYDGLSANVAEADEAEERNSRPTQAGRILAYLRAGNRITAIEALEQFGCFRLAARIHELRREGWQIEERTVETRSGKRVAEYSLATLTHAEGQPV